MWAETIVLVSLGSYTAVMALWLGVPNTPDRLVAFIIGALAAIQPAVALRQLFAGFFHDLTDVYHGDVPHKYDTRIYRVFLFFRGASNRTHGERLWDSTVKVIAGLLTFVYGITALWVGYGS